MFAGWKIAGITALAGALACGVLYVMLTTARADAVRAHADLKDTQRVLVTTQAQLKTVVEAKAEQDRLDQWKAEDDKAADDAAAELRRNLKPVVNQFTIAKETTANDPDDAFAAPVLKFAAHSLRQSAARIVRAGYGDQACAGPGGDSAGVSDCAAVEALIPEPNFQRQFATSALRIGEAYETCALQLVAIDKWQIDHNARVVAFNRAAP